MLIFSITGLFGIHNIEIDLTKPCAILIGENGVGKTTALKLLFCLACGDFEGLTQYPFETLTLKGNEQLIKIFFDDLFPICDDLQNLLFNDADKSLVRFLSMQRSNAKNREPSFRWAEAKELLNNLQDKPRHVYSCVLSAIYWGYDIDALSNYSDAEKLQLKEILKEINNQKCFLLSPIAQNSEFLHIGALTQDLLGISERTNMPMSTHSVFFYNSSDAYILSNKGVYPPVNDRLYQLSKEQMDWLSLEVSNEEFYDKELTEYVADSHSNIWGIKRSHLAEKIKESFEKNTLQLNAIIALNYFSDDEIISFNKKSGNYIRQIEDYAPKRFSGSFDTNLCQQVERFLVKNRKDIERYIEPMLIEGSVFSTALGREYHDPDTQQGMCKPELATIAFMHYYEDNIDLLKKSSSKKINFYERLLNKFLFNKSVTVCPRGLVIKNAAGAEIDISLMSSGEKKLIILLTIATFFENSIFLIDEPEISLSIVWQNWLLPEILKLNNSQKLVIATHSPYIAEDESVHEFVQPIYIEIAGAKNE